MWLSLKDIGTKLTMAHTYIANLQYEVRKRPSKIQIVVTVNFNSYDRQT